MCVIKAALSLRTFCSLTITSSKQRFHFLLTARKISHSPKLASEIRHLIPQSLRHWRVLSCVTLVSCSKSFSSSPWVISDIMQNNLQAKKVNSFKVLCRGTVHGHLLLLFTFLGYVCTADQALRPGQRLEIFCWYSYTVYGILVKHL